MSGERIKVGDQTPSEGIGERVEGEFFCASPPATVPFQLEAALKSSSISAKDDFLALARQEETSDRLTRQIALQLWTYLGPAAACFSTASIPPTWGHASGFSIDVLQDSCFRPLRSHFQA